MDTQRVDRLGPLSQTTMSTITHERRTKLVWFGVLLSFVLAAPVSAAPPISARPLPQTALFADREISWSGFVKYWKSFVRGKDRVTMVVALVAALALYIITRGKW